MDEDLQNKLTDKIIEYLENTEQFLVQEAPDFVSDYFAFIMIDTISNILGNLLIFVCGIVVIYIANKISLNLHYEDSEFIIKAGALVMASIFALVSFGHLIYYITFLIQLHFAPKTAMIYYLTQMINN